MYDDIVKRLKSFGYKVVAADKWVLEFLFDKVSNTIKNECNVGEIPDGLHQVAVDMVCGEFFLMKKGSGQLDGIDACAAIKQISEGDTSITYAVADGSITLDGLISILINGGRSQFVNFRRIRW